MSLPDLLRDLTAAAAIPEAEMHARKNAWPEVVSLLQRTIAHLNSGSGGLKQSSPEMSSLASAVLQIGPDNRAQNSPTYQELLEKAKRLAGSVLGQDETPQPAPQPAVPFSTNPEGRRALDDAVANNQARPLISRGERETRVLLKPKVLDPAKERKE